MRVYIHTLLAVHAYIWQTFWRDMNPWMILTSFPGATGEEARWYHSGLRVGNDLRYEFREYYEMPCHLVYLEVFNVYTYLKTVALCCCFSEEKLTQQTIVFLFGTCFFPIKNDPNFPLFGASLCFCYIEVVADESEAEIRIGSLFLGFKSAKKKTYMWHTHTQTSFIEWIFIRWLYVYFFKKHID